MHDKPIAIVDEQSCNNLLSVSWDISSVCNYKCSYCEPTYHDGKFKFPKLHSICSFLKEAEKLWNKKIYMEIKGGEPTYWKELPKFLKYTHSRGWGTCIVTNGSRDITWWQKNLEYMSDVNLSLHPESYCRKTIVEKIKYINERRTVLVKYMMYPPLFDECVAEIRRIRGELNTVKVKAFYLAQPGTLNEMYSYTEKQQTKVKEINKYKATPQSRIWASFPYEDRHIASALDTKNNLTLVNVQDLKVKNLNNWSGWHCNAGIDRIHIGIDGSIYRGQCKQGGLIGNIHTGKWSLPKEPVVCQKERCFCGSEILLKKWDRQTLTMINKRYRNEG